MNKPDPNRSRVRDIAKELIALSQKVNRLEELKKVGPLMFQLEDIYATENELDIVLRKYFYANSITEAYFNERYRLYGLMELGKHPTQVTNDRNNTLHRIKAGNITRRTFVEVMRNVMRAPIVNLTIEVLTPDNKIQKFDTAGRVETLLPPDTEEDTSK